MPNPIKLKKSIIPGNIPGIANLQIGELAYNGPDAILYGRKGTGVGGDTIVPLNIPELGGIIWQDLTDYSIGDVVTEGTTLYVCITAHKSDGSGLVGVDNPADGGTSWAVGQATAAEKGGIAFDNTVTYIIGDMVTSGGVPYVCHTLPVPNPGAFDAADWTEIGGVEIGGKAWITGAVYSIGDVVVESGIAYYCDTGHTSATFATDITNWTEIAPAERGGILHITTGQIYAVGDAVTLVGSNYSYVCKTAHVSTVDCDTAPDNAFWYQPGPAAYYPVTYNFTTDIAGGTTTACTPVPAVCHTYEGDGLTDIPNENGPHIFSVAPGSVGRSAIVLLEGFELSPVDYSTVLDGYIEIFSPVADNSWLKITI